MKPHANVLDIWPVLTSARRRSSDVFISERERRCQMEIFNVSRRRRRLQRRGLRRAPIAGAIEEGDEESKKEDERERE
ncbi:hypothetical protein L484_023944 [Morus notabilis]|uniref:Uncharacterized protein n=1 Tax=Morus notabilis TaxID=981085 RepID=W9R0E3_9ROSA|nr:hypothetical protein L484_023944 [Morus notabilis]